MKQNSIAKRLLEALTPHGGCSVSREELAALELLKSTGVSILEAAQAACAAVRAAQLCQKGTLRNTAASSEEMGIVETVQRVLDSGVAVLERREHSVALQVAAWRLARICARPLAATSGILFGEFYAWKARRICRCAP